MCLRQTCERGSTCGCDDETPDTVYLSTERCGVYPLCGDILNFLKPSYGNWNSRSEFHIFGSSPGITSRDLDTAIVPCWTNTRDTLWDDIALSPIQVRRRAKCFRRPGIWGWRILMTCNSLTQLQNSWVGFLTLTPTCWKKHYSHLFTSSFCHVRINKLFWDAQAPTKLYIFIPYEPSPPTPVTCEVYVVASTPQRCRETFGSLM